MIGSTFCDYKFVSKLGSGTFGEVFRCEKDGKAFAVKKVNEGKTSDIEISVGNNVLLSSPFLVKYHEVFKHIAAPGELFIVMDLCSEGDIRRLLKSLSKKKGIVLSQERMMKIFIQLLLGLFELHRNKIIHRDLKPDNVFVDSSDNVKIGDFGCGKILESSKDKGNTFFGTPLYMSPELIKGKPYDYKVDVWALGVMMFELCCLEPPFYGDGPFALYDNIVNGDFTKIPKSMYSDDFREAIHSMLQKNSEIRPSICDLLSLEFVQNHAKIINLFQYFPAVVGSATAIASISASTSSSSSSESVTSFPHPEHPSGAENLGSFAPLPSKSLPTPPSSPPPFVLYSSVTDLSHNHSPNLSTVKHIVNINPASAIPRASSAPKRAGHFQYMATASHPMQATGHVSSPSHKPTNVQAQTLHVFNPEVALLKVRPDFVMVKEIAKNKVYLVRDTKNEEKYVVKIIDEEEEGLEVDQALLQYVATCEYIVHYREILKLGMERSGLVMEYCTRGDLAQVIAEKKKSGGFFSDEEICMVVLQIGRGLAFLHEREQCIIHRDVKPKNILISEKGSYKLGDFGSATRMKTTKSLRKTVVGTNGYMAPEVLKQEGYRASADVFSFGLVLYEMIMLENPYYILGGDGEVGYSLEKALNAIIPPLQSTHNSADLMALVMGFLVKDPLGRMTIAKSLESKLITDFIAMKKGTV